MQSELIKRLDAKWIESTIGNSDGDVYMRLFNKCKVRGPHVESTLLACLAEMRNRGHSLQIDLPEQALSRGDITAILNSPRAREPTAAERVFVDRVVGVLLCHFGELVGRRDPVEQQLREALESDNDGTFGNGSHRAAIWLFDGLPTHDPLLKTRENQDHPRSVNPFAPTPRRVTPVLSRLYRDVTGGVFGAAIGKAALRRVESFAIQAIENAYEHATTNVKGRPIKTANVLQVRRVDSAEDEVDGPDGWALAKSSYFERLPYRPGRFCEIQVADGGPGIAARMASSDEEMTLDSERTWLGRAIRPTGTTKDEGAARGLGIPKLLTAAAMSDGLVMIRSGRLALSADFLDAGRKDDLEAGLGCEVRDESVWLSLESEIVEVGHRGGTQISLLVPDRSSG